MSGAKDVILDGLAVDEEVLYPPRAPTARPQEPKLEPTHPARPPIWQALEETCEALNAGPLIGMMKDQMSAKSAKSTKQLWHVREVASLCVIRINHAIDTAVTAAEGEQGENKGSAADESWKSRQQLEVGSRGWFYPFIPCIMPCIRGTHTARIVVPS